MKAWYFTNDKNVMVGDSKSVDWNPLKINPQALENSKTLVEAFLHAKGSILWQVNLSGFREHAMGSETVNAQTRTYLNYGIDLEPYFEEIIYNIVSEIITKCDLPSSVIDVLKNDDKVMKERIRQETWIYHSVETNPIKTRASWIFARALSDPNKETMLNIDNSPLTVMTSILSVALSMWETISYYEGRKARERYEVMFQNILDFAVAEKKGA